MAKSDFLLNLKTARNLFFHRVKTDHSALDPETVEGQLARAAIWLTPSSVKGFNEKDFPELPSEVRKELKDYVIRFLNIAKQVPSTEPATVAQIQEAMACFVKIMSIVKSYLPSGGELQQIRDSLAEVTFPGAVITWDFELGADSTGDPAVWVWIFVDSESANNDDFVEVATDIEQHVRESLSAAGVQRWPYIRFRTAKEQRALSESGK